MLNLREGIRDRSLILKGIGGLMLLTGIGSAFLGPLEHYPFYMFSEGGRLHYNGFGVGSFMFANIAGQLMGYYLIGLTGIVLGYGHLKLRRWARLLTLTLLWAWLITGLPLMFVAYGIFITSKDPSLPFFLVTLPFGLLLYPVLPLILYRFYRGDRVRAAFERDQPDPTWLEAIPLPVRGLCLIFGLYILVLHVLLYLRGLFPLFGRLLSGLPGIIALDVSFLLLALLTWGLARLKRWAWWGSLAGFAALTVSSALTFSRHSLRDVLLTLDFPQVEADAFLHIPFLDFYPAIPAIILPLVTIVLLLAVRGHFFPGGEVKNG